MFMGARVLSLPSVVQQQLLRIIGSKTGTSGLIDEQQSWNRMRYFQPTPLNIITVHHSSEAHMS